MYVGIRDHVQGFSSIAAFASDEVSLDRGANARLVNADLVTPSLFSLLGVRPALGRFFSEDEDRAKEHVAVLGFDVWRTQFGNDPTILGRPLSIGKGSYVVVGVAPPGFTGVDLSPVGVWLPLGAAASEFGSSLDCGNCYWLTTVGRLRPGRMLAQVETEATTVFRGLGGSRSADTSAVVTLGPIQEARGPAGAANSSLSVWLYAVSLAVLLIACANVTNLLLARAISRDREIAIRLALGASHGALVGECLIEGVLVAAGGGAAAMALVVLAAPVLSRALLPAGVGVGTMTPGVLLFTGGVVMIAGLVSSLAPALRVNRSNLTGALRTSQLGMRSSGSTSRQVLVVGQIALTLILLVGAGLFLGSLRKVLANPLGFDPDHLVSVSVDLKSIGYPNSEINVVYEAMRQRVASLAGVGSASIAIGSPFSTSLASALDVPGVDDSVFRGPGGVPYVQMVSPEYFRTLGTAIRLGRDFVENDRSGAARVAIVNETMAHRVWPERSPLGRCLKVGSLTGVSCSEIVGVVQDVRRNGITEAPTMQYYIPLSQRDSGFVVPVTALLIRTKGRADGMAGALRRELQSISPNLPYVRVEPIGQLYAWQLRPWKLGSVLFMTFGAIATALAVFGLYGLLSYVVGQRTREVGIRIALGASRTAILLSIMGHGAKLASVGIVIGGVGAVLSGRLIVSLLYGVAPTNVAVMVTASALLLVVALAASYGPAYRATRIEPLVALQSE
jgi:predicted permease